MMVMIMKVTSLVVVVMVMMTVTVTSTQLKMFYKVEVSYLGLFKCLLAVGNVTTALGCSVKCQQTPDCTFFCLTETGCQLHSARVGLHYQGAGEKGLVQLCYTSWIYPRDVAHTAVITASDPALATSAKNNAINGFFCYNPGNFCYTSSKTNNPRWIADLGAARRVTTVKIATKKQPMPLPEFQQVEVRVGYDRVVLTNNQLMGVYPGVAAVGEEVTFTAKQPYLLGSVVSVQSLGVGVKLSFCDIQILQE